MESQGLLLEPFAGLGEALFESLLTESDGEVAAGAFEDAAHHVGAPAQAPRHGVGVVHSDEDGIYLVHDVEEFLAAREIVCAKGVEYEATEFADGVCQTSQVRRCPYAEVVSRGHGATLDEGEGDRGLREFLQGVFNIATVVHAGLLLAEVDSLS